MSSVHLRLITFLGPYKKRVGIALLAVFLAAGFAMIQPKLLAWAIDTGLKPSSATQLAADVPLNATTFPVKSTDTIEPGQVLRVGGGRRGTEQIKVVSIGDQQIEVERGVNGSSAIVHLKNENLAQLKQSFGGKTNTLLIAGAALMAAALCRGMFAYCQTYLGEWLGQHVAFDLRNQIYEKLQRLSYAYHDKQQTGELMSRATQDVEATRMYIQMGLLRAIDITCRVALAAFFMFSTDWRLAAVAWAFLPFIAYLSVRTQTISRRLWTGVQERLAVTTSVLQENLTGVRVVKAFSREPYESEKFDKVATDLFDWNYRQNRVQATNTPIYQLLGLTSQAAVLYVGARMITGNDLSPGNLTAFLFYLQLLTQPMRILGFIIQQFARAGASGLRIFEILDAESAVKEKPDAIELANLKGAVAFHEVAFGYDSISPVLRNVTFEAESGKIVALLGPTGSGKTTVVNLLPRFYDVTGGSITIDGIDIRDVTLASLRANIGIIQQDVFLFSATIRENIAYGAVDSTYEQIIEAAKIARIHDYIMSQPDGYDTWVGERGITLSGGQKQRISIARTLLLDPKILILDDSTSSVDMQTEYLIQQALSAVMKGRTTLVIAQRLRTVKNADQILVMRDGEIIERGTHDELIATDGLYREIYDLELRDQEEALKRSTMAEPETDSTDRPRGPRRGGGRPS